MAKKIELLHTTYDESGNIESQEVVHPLTSPDCIIMENGKTLDEVMGDGIATPTLTHEGTSFKVGVGDSNIEVVDGDVAGMTLKGQSYQNILPKPTTLIMETDEKEFKINDKIDSNIIIDDNIAEIATVKGKTIVNTVQEESGSEYTVLGEDLSGQSIVHVKETPTLEGQTLVNLGIVRGKFISNEWGYVTFDTKLIKSSTKYYYKLFNLDDGLQHVVTDGNGNEFYSSYTSNKWSTFTTTSKEPASFECFTIHIKTSPTEEQVKNIQLLILEYQDGMENLDIPYFEGEKYFESNIKGVTLQGQTLVNTIQEPSGADATVLELDADIDAQYATIDNTVQGGIHGATLKGQTLVNLDKNTYPITKWGTNENNNNYFVDVVTLASGMFKPATKYLFKIYGLSCDYDIIQLQGISGSFSKVTSTGFTFNKNGSLILQSSDSIQTLTSYAPHFTRNDIKNLTEQDKQNFKMIILEYQDGMENWDIPYFEGMQSVEVPSVKATGKNLFDKSKVKYNTTIIADNGREEANNLYMSSDFISVKPNENYVSNNMGVIFFYNENWQYIGEKNNGTVPQKFTTPVNCKYIRVRCWAQYSEVEKQKEVVELEQLEQGSTATEYEPYKSSVSTILGANLIVDSEKGRYYHYESGYMATDGGSRYDSYRANVEGLTSVYVKNGHSNYTFWDANMIFISGVTFVNGLISDGSHNKDGVVNVPSNAKYMRFAYDTVENNGLPCVSEVIALRKVGDVQDELDLTTGELTQRIGEIVLDGSEDWEYGNKLIDNTELFYHTHENLNGNGGVLSDKYLSKFVWNIGEEGVYVFNDKTYNRSRIGLRVSLSKLSGASVSTSTIKEYLSQNPITVQYQLATPIIKTVDLSIVDQDNNPIKSIQTHPTVTHVSTSSNGLIPFVTIPSQLKYPTIIKPSTTYTVQLKQTTVNSEFPLTINLGGTTMAVPSTKFTITTPSELTSQDVIFTGKNNVIGEVVITEGDTTGIEYPFFEGMNDVKSPKLLATGKNLFNFENGGQTNGLTFSNNGNNNYVVSGTCIKDSTDYYAVAKDRNNGTFTRLNSLPVGTKIIVSKSSSVGRQVYLSITQKDGSPTKYVQSYTTTANDNVIQCFVRFMNGDTFDNAQLNLQIEIGSTATSYEPYKGVTIEQDIDSIPLTSDMFEQGNILADNIVIGSSYQQIGRQSSTVRISAKTLIKVKPNCTYTLQSHNIKMWMMAFDKNGGYIKNMELSNTITTDANTYYLALKLQYNDDSDITPSTLDSLNLTLQEVTDEIVLRSIGDVKDTLNLTTGEYVQRIGEVVFDGSEGIVWGVTNDDGKLATTICFTVHEYIEGAITDSAICSHFQQKYSRNDIEHFYNENLNGSQALVFFINRDKLTTLDHNGFNQWLSQNPLTIQYVLATPIIRKVNLTNTTKLPSYASTTHYDTIVPSNSLIPNIKIPSTIDYNVAIKPSTEYTIRANTSDNLTVDLGGATGTLSNGKVTLTTPDTLTHNEVKFSGTGKVKELMVVEGNEIKDNVPFFNGMKNVEMGGIKLVNIARFKNVTELVTANTNKNQFTYTGNGSGWGYVMFDNTLLKPNTKYTIYMNVITITSDNSHPIKIEFGHNQKGYVDITGTGIFKKAITTIREEDGFDRNIFSIAFRPCSSGGKVVIQNLMVIEGDWTHLDEIPYIESEMIIEQPIIRSQGKNLFDIKEATTEWNGATIKSNSDNTITYTPNSDNSAALEAGFYFKQPIKVKTGTKYTYSMKRISGGNADFSGSINNQILVRKKDGTITSIIRMSDFNTNTFNQTLTAIYSFDDTVESIVGVSPIMYGVRNLTSPIVMQFQIEEGSSATSYEPFKQHTLSSNRVIGYEDGCYYTWDTGIKESAESIASVISDVEGLNVAYVTHGSSNFSFYDKDGAYLSGSMFLSTATDFDRNGFIKIPANAKYMKMACGNTINDLAKDSHLKVTVTGELPLRSLPNGVCDTLNLVTGEYVQRVREIVLDGSQKDEYWLYNGMNQTFRIQAFDVVSIQNASTDPLRNKILVSSDKLTSRTYVEDWNSGTFISLALDKRIVLRIEGITTRSELIKYLKQNPITVQYELETPIVRKIGLTAKGNYKESLAVNNLSAMVMGSYGDKTYRMQGTFQSDCYDDSPIFTDGYHVRHYPTDSHGEYEYIALIGNFIYINILKDGAYNDTIGRQWLSQHPIKVGYISTAQSSTSYSNILKPIFFNNVNVQFMNNNIDIQPTLILQARSTNSYVMDMMKPNTLYTSKFLQSANGSTFIDGIVVSVKSNNTFTSPSTLTNKLMITPINRQEFMIIEGDVASKQLPYYKGIRSSFDNTDKVEVLSQNKNLFDINAPFTKDGAWSTVIEGNSIISTRINDNANGAFGAGFRVNNIKPNTKYILSLGAKQGAIYVYSNSDLWGNALSVVNHESSLVFTTNSDTKYITIGFNYGQYDIGTVLTTTDIKLEEGTVATSYQPHKENSTIINMPTQLETVEVVRPVMEKGCILNNSGIAADSPNERRLPFIPVQPGEILSFRNSNDYRPMNVHLYDIDKNFIRYIYTNGTGDLIIPDNCYFIRGFCRETNTSDLTITRQAYKPIQLNSLPNGVYDEIIMKPNSSKAQLVQRVSKVVLDGSGSYYPQLDKNGNMSFIQIGGLYLPLAKGVCGLLPTHTYCDKLMVGNPHFKEEQGVPSDKSCVGVYQDFVRLCLHELDENEQIYRNYLQQNPITIYYELATPIIHEIQLKGYPHVYENGTVTLNTDIPHQTLVSYNVNQEQLINTQNETIIRHDQQIDDLYYYIEMYLEEIYQMELFRMKLELSL